MIPLRLFLVGPMLAWLSVLPSGKPSEVRAASAGGCQKVTVVVMGDEQHHEPGVPIEIVVRGRDGSVISTGETDAKGYLTLKICWNAEPAPAQIEARLRISARDYVGSVMSCVAPANSFCLFLPPAGTDCLSVAPVDSDK